MKKSELNLKIERFFARNPNPTDKKVHKFADSLGLDTHKVEQAIYSMLTAKLREKK